jgi:hypothetical protein
MIKNCVICGAEFETTDRRVKYCGDACREERSRKYIAANKARLLAYAAQYRKANACKARAYREANKARMAKYQIRYRLQKKIDKTKCTG